MLVLFAAPRFDDDDDDGNNAAYTVVVVVTVAAGCALGGTALRVDGDDFSAATPHHQYSLQTLG